MHTGKRNNPLGWNKKILVLATMQAVLLILGGSSVSANECKQASKQLRGSYDVVQANGGIWGLLEKSSSLKDKAVLGLQLDSKLQRAVLGFENNCLKKNSVPDAVVFQKIGSLLDRSHSLNSKAADTVPAAQLIADIQDIIKNLDELLASLEPPPAE